MPNPGPVKNNARPPRVFRGQQLAIAVALLGLTALSAWWLLPRPAAQPPLNFGELLDQAQRALRQQNAELALQLATSALELRPDSAQANLVAGEAATRLERYPEAIQHYDQIQSGDQLILARNSAAEVLRHTGDMVGAEERFKFVVSRDPRNLLAHRRLAWILNVQGRRREAGPHLFALTQQGAADREELVLLGNEELLMEVPAELLETSQPAAVINLAHLGRARQQLQWGDPIAARISLDQLDGRSLPPAAKLQAHALTGRLLLMEDRLPDFDRWVGTLDLQTIADPDHWELLGEWALQHGQLPSAARCFQEVLQLSPNRYGAHHQLATVLNALGQTRLAESVSARSAVLRDLNGVLNRIHEHPEDELALRQAEDLLWQLGRVWESVAWGVLVEQSVAAGQRSDTAHRERMMVRIQQLNPDLPQSQPAVFAEELRGLSQLPLPDLSDVSRSAVTGMDTDAGAGAGVRFQDAAAEMGLAFQYTTGLTEVMRGRPMYSFPGGGAGVLDLDRDGWPDLWLTQGTTWPPNADQQTQLDGVFRNRQARQFDDVTSLAGVAENRLTHGVACGDFDDDGFPDVYVANIHDNRLFRNNGDGTFTDISHVIPEQQAWTTSCLIADLTGDGLADLVDINYVQGQNVYEMVCERDGQQRACNPMSFLPQPDRLLVGDGAGGFADQTRSAGWDLPGGNGLGLIAADLDADRRPDVFVGNDADPNFLLQNLSEPQRNIVAFVDRGAASGTSADGHGQSQACMGIAQADADRDGMLDLYVTNYFQEHNVLYRQVLPGVFLDSSLATGLYEPSLSRLGFGAQFLDADLNGWPDLIVANGHVDDFSHIGAEYQMQPQLYVNSAPGHFREVAASQAGAYFQQRSLGRGMAVLDWNRDGRPEAVVSHLDYPAALLRNDSATDGHFVSITLVGTRCGRDAIGAAVMVECGDQRWNAQQAAGSGYMASNQKCIHLGLSSVSGDLQVTVDWPFGERQTFTGLVADGEWILIENHVHPVRLPF